ncbi:hypothetical protein LPB140_08930 [Sphingorhabdus lutea]|uniref:Methyltransferase domain-containing protein n=1 Tax=Sphingorhabdus lutea TaxID=1913578 RepID=A0A1L3JCP7_9SPHN|nr:hypothetical protein [Sphingorhabdus lutea]APG62892.1 hypothetical protein LPB140_08930 [Sphingorhabdus lutea]
MNNAATQQKIFHIKRRQAKCERAAMMEKLTGEIPFLWQYLADEIADRIMMVDRKLAKILLIGPAAHLISRQNKLPPCAYIREIHLAATNIYDAQFYDIKIIGDDVINWPDRNYDLIVTAGFADSVDDLPGHLIQLRHLLKADGLLLCSLFGSGSLHTLKQILLNSNDRQSVMRCHPQIELRSAADLLTRTGFALPVADSDIVQIRYSKFKTLIRDIRAHGLGNSLHQPIYPITRSEYANILSLWNSLAVKDGRVSENFAFIHLSGWAPDDSQPKPAARGSGKISLHDALNKK